MLNAVECEKNAVFSEFLDFSIGLLKSHYDLSNCVRTL